MPEPAFVSIFVAFLAISWILRSPWLTGVLGELRVNRALRTKLDPQDYRLFADLTLPSGDGTTQIDHILVSRFGVFVIETKCMKGWIFGSRDQPAWTQVIFRRKSRFQNPIRQNYKHVRAVQELLSLEGRKVHDVVVFVGPATFKSDVPNGVVWGVQPLIGFIQSKRIAVLDDDELRAVIGRLSEKRLRSTLLGRRAHVRHVRSQIAVRHGGTSNCPRCGATMVKRTNRQSGSRFLACTRFPACRGTRAAP